MKIKTIILLSCLLIIEIIPAQFSVSIVNENFTSNKMRWDIHDTENSSMQISEGSYIIENKKMGTALTSCIEVPQIQNINYRITATIKKTNGIDDNGYGIAWGSKDENNELEFVISGNGQFKITKWANGSKSDIVKWTYSSAIHKWNDVANIIKIESLGDYTRYYINNKFVAISENNTQFGNRVGFILNEAMQINADNIVIENLTPQVAKKNGSAQSIEIKNLEIANTSGYNQIKANETAWLNILLVNNGELPVKDLVLTLENIEHITGLEYDRKVMVDEIAAKDLKSVRVKINAYDDLESFISSLTVNLSTIDNTTLDTKSLNLTTVAKTPEYSENNTETGNNEDQESFDNFPEEIETGSDCSKGCSGAGLISLLVALILTII